KRLFKSRANITGVEVKTRNLLPLEALTITVNALEPYLSGCEALIQKINEEAQRIQNQILKSLSKKQDIGFYLGELRGGKRPEIVMVNDGMVKVLITEKKVATYPTDMAYVNWSSKILRSVPESTVHIGLQ